MRSCVRTYWGCIAFAVMPSATPGYRTVAAGLYGSIPADCVWADALRRVYELRYFNIAENEGEDEE